MELSRKRKRYLYIIGIFFLLCYMLPNIINFRERRFFSDSRRLKQAEALSSTSRDSIQLIPGEFYQRNKIYHYFFGEKNRRLWTTPVFFRVFNYDTTKGGLQPYEIGGSQQTISIRLRDKSGKNWVLRSMNKDQQNVLPWWLQPSIIRPLFRDQVSAMNPYGAKVVASLSAAISIPHTEPEIYWVPFVEKHKAYNERIAGRIVYLEQHIDDTWKHSPLFQNASQILDTDQMQEALEKKQLKVDALLYLKIRLFDMVINDWDRHQDQWKWALTTDTNGLTLLKPIAKDRDIAFYIFDEGIINKVAIRVNPKFQSFRREFGSIKGLMHQSRKLDVQLLKGIPLQTFLSTANEIQAGLSPVKISNAFRLYPPVIYQQFGKEHETILAARLSQLPEIAEKFYRLVNED